VLRKMANQDVALQTFKAIQQFFNPQQHIGSQLPRDLEQVQQSAQQCLQENLQHVEPKQGKQQLVAIYHLAHVSEQLLNPVFAQTDAVGSVMRKRLQPLSDFILDNIKLLQGQD